MPEGVYKRTQKHNKNIALSHMGDKNPMYGKPRSEEARRKTSESLRRAWANTDPLVAKARKEQLAISRRNRVYGPQSIATRRKRSASMRGDKSWRWKGGVTEVNKAERNRVEFALWREAVYARDNWACRKCGDKRGGNLNPHHVHNFSQYPELRFVVDNGVTLCSPCHTRFHRIYGKSSNNRKQLEQFLGRLLC